MTPRALETARLCAAGACLLLSGPALWSAGCANVANLYAVRATLGDPTVHAPTAAAALVWAASSARWRTTRSSWLAAGRAYSAIDRHAAAAAAYEHALQIAQADPFWFVLGNAQASAGERIRALESWARAPSAPRFLIVADELASRGEWMAARETLDFGLEVHPRSGVLAVALGDLYRQAGDEGRAETLYTRATTTNGPHAARAWLQLAGINRSRRQWADAIQSYHACADSDSANSPVRAECFEGLAEIALYVNRDRAAAQVWLGRVLALNPAHPGALTRRGELALASGRLHEAAGDFAKALRANSHDAYVQAMSGVVQARQQRACLDVAEAVEAAASQLLGGTAGASQATAAFAVARDACPANLFFTRAWIFSFVWAGDAKGERQALAWAKAHGVAIP